MPDNYSKRLSIILPTYNECENLAVLIPKIEEGFKSVDFEIIVVDDGSKDGTDGLINDLSVRFNNIFLLARPKLGGIGSALRDGYNMAKGEYILSSDADLSFSVDDMVALYNKVTQGYDVVVGYRHGSNASYERRNLPIKLKYLFSRYGNWLIRKMSGLKIRDFSVNFRVIRRDKWIQLLTKENTNSILYEMILKAHRKNMKITDIPVNFSERKFGQSKLNLWIESPRFLFKFIKYTFFDR
jgi:dolichol-phosphate mannosyltransferase